MAVIKEMEEKKPPKNPFKKSKKSLFDDEDDYEDIVLSEIKNAIFAYFKKTKKDSVDVYIILYSHQIAVKCIFVFSVEKFKTVMTSFC